MTPVVSVIIPSYNHEKYVGECIQSVLNQTFQDFEIVITDDGSSDRSIEVIEGFTDPRIKLFKHSVNKGACIAVNNCIQHARGKYIAMLSSDDAWYPEKLDVQVKYLDNHPNIAVVFGKVDWIDEHSNIINNPLFAYKSLFEVHNRTRSEWLRYFFLTGNCLCHPCSLVRAECYREVGMLNSAYGSLPDLDLWIRICLKHNIHILDKRLIRFRKILDESNASGYTNVTLIRNRFEHRHSLDHYLQITNPEDLLLIFPEVGKFGEVTVETIPYLIGRIAIDTGEDYKVLWGLDTICKLLKNEKIAQIIEARGNFTYLDFIKLSGSCDVYRISTFTSEKPLSMEKGYKFFLSASKRYVKELYLISLQLLESLKKGRQKMIKNYINLLRNKLRIRVLGSSAYQSEVMPGMQQSAHKKTYDFPENFNFDKKVLIDYVYTRCLPPPLSFADLGGIWNIDGAYTFYTLSEYGARNAFLVDFNFTEVSILKSQTESTLKLIRGNFGEEPVVQQIGNVDAVFLFDVLLHQVKPDWNEILKAYSEHTRYFVIHNQQWTGSEHTVRLLDMGREEYFKNVPHDKEHPTYTALFDKMNEEIQPGENRAWRDTPSVWQWGITDHDLIKTMDKLGYKMQYYKNCGRFGSLPNFENHAFVFQKT
jgi:glycosyltransferase involved in cell wall biosynthesis